MTEMPKAYTDFLATASPQVVEAVTPVLKESVNEGQHGVLVTLLRSDAHAEVSGDVPFGEIRVADL